MNLLSISTTFFWSQLKSWSGSQQCFAISFFSQSQCLTDILCSSERDFKDWHRRNIIILVAQWWMKHRVWIKYYKVFRKSCNGWREAPIMVECHLPKFWNVYFPKSSKTVFLEVLCIKWTKQLESITTHWRNL